MNEGLHFKHMSINHASLKYSLVLAVCEYQAYSSHCCATFQEIVNTLLGRYNKKLDENQMASLLSKEWSVNPLWLAIACEELRVFGQFRQVSDKINQLADGLLE